MKRMRRLCAIWLAALFAFSVAGPALLAGSESQLPECCRRSGKHRCGLNPVSPQDQSSDTFLDREPDKCPCVPGSGTVGAHRYAGGVISCHIILVSPVSHTTLQVQSEARYRGSYNRARQKRGPPLFA
jgi:hypothetical protein